MLAGAGGPAGSGASATSGETNVAHAVTLGVKSVAARTDDLDGQGRRSGGGCFYKWG